METNKFDIILEKNENLTSYFEENREELKRLKNASMINIFVGSNNSGKSRFIRNLLESNNKKINLEETKNLINYWNHFICSDHIIYYNHKMFRELGNIKMFEIQDDNGYVKLFKFNNQDLIFQSENLEILKKNNSICKIIENSQIQSNSFTLNGRFYGSDINLETLKKHLERFNNSLKLLKTKNKNI